MSDQTDAATERDPRIVHSEDWRLLFQLLPASFQVIKVPAPSSFGDFAVDECLPAGTRRIEREAL